MLILYKSTNEKNSPAIANAYQIEISNTSSALRTKDEECA